MNKQTDQAELTRIIAQQTLLNESIVEAFIGQLFIEIEKSIIVDSHITVEGLGLFRVIKSGNGNRILYLGSNAPINKTVDLSHRHKEPINTYSNNQSVQTEIPSIDDNNKEDKEEEEKIEKAVNYQNTSTYDETSEADAIVIRNFLDSAKKNSVNRTEQVVNPRKLNLVRTCIISLIILVLLGIGYIVLWGATAENKQDSSDPIAFTELENSDTIRYSRIVIPQSDVSLQYIAQTYYGNNTYWPYIYEANKNIVNNQLIIQAGSIIKVPKIAGGQPLKSEL